MTKPVLRGLNVAACLAGWVGYVALTHGSGDVVGHLLFASPLILTTLVALVVKRSRWALATALAATLALISIATYSYQTADDPLWALGALFGGYLAAAPFWIATVALEAQATLKEATVRTRE